MLIFIHHYFISHFLKDGKGKDFIIKTIEILFRFLEYPSKYGEAGSGDFTEQCDPAGCLVELSIQFVISKIF